VPDVTDLRPLARGVLTVGQGRVILRSMIHDETQDQDLYNEQKALPADAEPLLGKVDEIVPAPPHGDRWVAEAVTAVEASITKLMDEFRVQPFIHRVEHSLHIRLVQLLGEWEHLRGWYPIGGSGFKMQLIHKEWPEARPRKKPDLIADQRRGSFDLVVLAPCQLQRTVLEQFIVGCIDAPIVIELGLNYGKQHLTGDRQKLANSKVQHPYFVHLSRMPSSRQGATEDVIAGIRERPRSPTSTTTWK
jgi:hypothetical protein